MIELFRQFMTIWNDQKNQRLKLQQSYIILAILGFIATGILSLVDVKYVHLTASLSGLAIAIFLINTIVWTVIDLIVSPKLPKAQLGKKVTSKKK